MEFHIAFQRVEARIRAVPESDFRTVNLDVPSIVTQTLGVVPNVLRHHEALAQAGFDVAAVHDLRDYARALGDCHVNWRGAGAPSEELPRLAKRVRESRRRLHDYAVALVADGSLDAQRVRKMRGGNAYRLIAFDVLGLVDLFLEAWDRIAGKTPASTAELQRARADANRLLFAIGRKSQQQRARAIAEATYLRRQAYALFVRTYAEVRSAVRFARRAKGDVDRIIPSLFAERGKKVSATKRMNGALPEQTHGEESATSATQPDFVRARPAPHGAPAFELDSILGGPLLPAPGVVTQLLTPGGGDPDG